MNDYIDEGIIPQNFNWRAGIGKDSTQVQQQNIYNNQEELYDGGIRLTRENAIPKWPYANVNLTEQLLAEIDTQVTDAINKYRFEVLDTILTMKIKEELKQICFNIKSKYKMYMNEGFYNALYNQCKTAYEQNFVTLRDDINVLTEFVEIDGTLYGNPLLIYGYFQM